MASGLVTISGVSVFSAGPPPVYTLTLNSTAGITVGDHFLSNTIGTDEDAVYLVTVIVDGQDFRVEDSLVEAHVTPFGIPGNVGAAYATPGAGQGLTFAPENAPGWRAAHERNFAILD
jgi:hypothetical protein